MNIDNFVTPLGTVELNIEFANASSLNLLSAESGKQIQTPNLRIEVISFNDVSTWMDELGYPVDETKGWIIRTYQLTDFSEQLTITCILKPNNAEINWAWDHDENLDAVLFENSTHFLSIGTEDGEALRQRSKSDDYMPSRFAKELGVGSENFSFLTYPDWGFKMPVPELRKGEHLYFHFLAAVDSRKRSLEFPDGNDMVIHSAVDFPKHILIKRLNIPE